MKKYNKIILGIIIVNILLIIFYSLFSIFSIVNDPFTSFPWWSGIIFSLIYFGPTLLIEIVVLIILKIKNKN